MMIENGDDSDFDETTNVDDWFLLLFLFFITKIITMR